MIDKALEQIVRTVTEREAVRDQENKTLNQSRSPVVSQADIAKLAEYPGLVDRMKAAERGLADSRTTIEQLESVIKSLRDERHEAIAQRDDWMEKAATLKNERDEARMGLEREACALAARRRHWMKSTQDLERQIAPLRYERDRAIHEAMSMRDDRAHWMKLAQDLENRVVALAAERDRAIEKLNDDEQCGWAVQVMGYQATIKDSERVIETMQKELDALTQQLEVSKTQNSVLKAHLANVRGDLGCRNQALQEIYDRAKGFVGS